MLKQILSYFYFGEIQGVPLPIWKIWELISQKVFDLEQKFLVLSGYILFETKSDIGCLQNTVIGVPPP